MSDVPLCSTDADAVEHGLVLGSEAEVAELPTAAETAEAAQVGFVAEHGLISEAEVAENMGMSILNQILGMPGTVDHVVMAGTVEDAVGDTSSRQRVDLPWQVDAPPRSDEEEPAPAQLAGAVLGMTMNLSGMHAAPAPGGMGVAVDVDAGSTAQPVAVLAAVSPPAPGGTVDVDAGTKGVRRYAGKSAGNAPESHGEVALAGVEQVRFFVITLEPRVE